MRSEEEVRRRSSASYVLVSSPDHQARVRGSSGGAMWCMMSYSVRPLGPWSARQLLTSISHPTSKSGVVCRSLLPTTHHPARHHTSISRRSTNPPTSPNSLKTLSLPDAFLNLLALPLSASFPSFKPRNESDFDLDYLTAGANEISSPSGAKSFARLHGSPRKETHTHAHTGRHIVHNRQTV